MNFEESKFNINIKPEFLSLLANSKTDKSIDDKVNLSIAIFLFTEKTLSLARAAELAGKSLGDFIDILIEHNIPWAEYTEEHKIQDDATIQFILEEENKNDQGNV
jgi:predicted HTH domain antitoxin